MQIIREKKQFILGLIVLIVLIFSGYILMMHFTEQQIANETTGRLPQTQEQEELAGPAANMVTGVVKSIENQKIVVEVLRSPYYYYPDFAPEILTIILSEQVAVEEVRRKAVTDEVIGKKILATSRENMKDAIKNRGEFIANSMNVVDFFPTKRDNLEVFSVNRIFGVIKNIESQRIVVETEKNLHPDFVPKTLTIIPRREGSVFTEIKQKTVEDIVIGERIVVASRENMKDAIKNRGEFVADFIRIDRVGGGQ